MLKYVNCGIVFQEIPEEVTLSINISNCPCRCPGCHSSYLWEDTGEPLDRAAVDRLVGEYGQSITCICLMGGDADTGCVDSLAAYIKEAYPSLHIGWYSGRANIPGSIDRTHFDYIKTGPYLRHLGGLKDRTTNQRLYRIATDGTMEDMTHLFWKENT